MTPEENKEGIRGSRSPHDIWVASGHSREAYLIALEEEAKQADEFKAFEATPESAVELRDARKMRWERIAIRIFGDPHRVQAVRDLYDEAKGEGASKRSYTGRGRRFPGMQDSEMLDEQDGPEDADPSAIAFPTESRFFGIGAEQTDTVSPEHLAELEIFRRGSAAQIRQYLETHLHSDRFYLDDGRIWLELPNRSDIPPTGGMLVWYAIPTSPRVMAPSAGTRAGLHVVPSGWDTTLCTIPVSTWQSGTRDHDSARVTCRWCSVRLIAAEVTMETPAQAGYPRVDLPPRDTDADVAGVSASFIAFVESVVLPLRSSDPERLRLDGRTSGSTWDVAGRFQYAAKRWRVHGDTRIEPLLVAYEAAKSGHDPFTEGQTKGGQARLDLAVDLQARTTTRFKHMYIYED